MTKRRSAVSGRFDAAATLDVATVGFAGTGRAAAAGRSGIGGGSGAAAGGDTGGGGVGTDDSDRGSGAGMIGVSVFKRTSVSGTLRAAVPSVAIGDGVCAGSTCAVSNCGRLAT